MTTIQLVACQSSCRDCKTFITSISSKTALISKLAGTKPPSRAHWLPSTADADLTMVWRHSVGICFFTQMFYDFTTSYDNINSQALSRQWRSNNYIQAYWTLLFSPQFYSYEKLFDICLQNIHIHIWWHKVIDQSMQRESSSHIMLRQIIV